MSHSDKVVRVPRLRSGISRSFRRLLGNTRELWIYASALSVLFSGLRDAHSQDLVVGTNTPSNTRDVFSGTNRFANTYIGLTATATNNTLTVRNLGTLLTNSGDLYVGSFGSANRLIISNGARAQNNEGRIGSASGSSNNLALVTGAGSFWTSIVLDVGRSGSVNSLTLTNGGRVASGTGSIGSLSTASNNIALVTGAGSSWSNSANFFIGNEGSINRLVVSNGGIVRNADGVVGSSAGSSNNVALVTGAGSLWTNSGDVRVGSSGNGNQLVVSNGAAVRGRAADIGSFSTASNNAVLVIGAGSLWSNSSTVTVGRQGLNNSLTVVAGGRVAASGILLADSNGSSGTLNVGRFGANDAAGTVVTPTIAFGRGTGVLNFNQGDAVVMTSVISGNGTLNQLGAGTTTLAALNTYGGVTTVGRGVLRVTNLADAGVSSAMGTNASIVLSNGGILDYAGTTNSAMNRTINLAGGNGGIGVSNSAVSLTLSGVISNTGNLIKSGLGRLILAAANTFTGTTTVSAGVLRAANNAALGLTAAGTRVASGAALELTGGITVGAESLDLSGTGIGGGGALRSVSGNNIYQGTITNTAAARINADAGLLTLSGAINANNQLLTLGGAGNMAVSGAITNSTAGLTKDGTGTATLTGVSTYTGATTVGGGTLALSAGGSLSAVTAIDLTGSGSVFDISGITASGSTNGSLAGVAGSRVNLGTKNLNVGGNNTSTTFAGVIGGAGSFTKSGTGTMLLTGQNTYGGVTTVGGGVLRVTNLADAGTSSAIGTNATIVLSNGGILDYAGTTNSAMNRGIDLAGGNGGIGVSNSAVSLTLGGVIGNTGNFVKSGPGRLVLTAANTFTGTTTVTGGTLALSGGGSLSALTAIDLTSSGSVFDISGITASGSTNGSLAGVAGSQVNLGTKNLNVGGNNTSTTFAGVIGGSGSLTKTGAGTMALTGVNAYTGGTLVNGGTLSLNATNTLADAGAVTVTGVGSVLTNSTNFFVGNASTGNQLIVTNGGTVHNRQGVIGNQAASGNNVASVTGAGSLWTNGSDLFVGNAGSGNQLIVGDGGRVRSRDGIVGAQILASNNLATVTGAGSLWTNSGDVNVGVFGSGNQLVVSNGGTVHNIVGRIGDEATSSNNIATVTGAGSRWTNNSLLSVGLRGSGNRLLVLNGASVSSSFGSVGSATGANNNTATVDGSGSVWTNDGEFSVGNFGSGNRLVVSNGGRVLNAAGKSGSIGEQSVATNNAATVTGAGSLWEISDFKIGNAGSGNRLVISNGGTVRSSFGAIGSASAASNNAVLVTGAGSLWTNNDTFRVGNSGSGNQLVVSNGATVASGSESGNFIGHNSASSNNLVLVTGAGSLWSNSSTVTVGRLGLNNSLTVVAGGRVAASGILLADSNGASGTLNIGRFGANDAAGTVVTPTISFGRGTGALNFNQSDAVVMTSVISGNGTLNQLGTGTTTLSAANTFSGTTTVSAGVLRAANNTALGSTAAGTRVASGAALELTGGITVGAESLDLSGTGIGGGGALRSVSGNNIYQGTITNTAAARINADAGLLTLSGAINANNQLLTLGGSGNMAVSGPITNSTAGLTKDGTGTATLTGVSTYTGATTVGGGTLALSGGGRLSALTAIDLTSSGSVFDISGITASGSTNGSLAGVAGSRVNLGSKNLNVGGNNTSTTFAGVIGGAGSLTKTGTGTMALTGINAYTGGTLVNGGTLSLNATNTLADAGTVTVTGVGSVLTSSTNLFVGNLASGNQLVVSNGGTVRNIFGFVGNASTSSSNIATVTGVGSVWTNDRVLFVGTSGTDNRLVVSNGGTVRSGFGVLGNGSTANIATVTGVGSVWTNRSGIIVGHYLCSGNQLVVSNGGTLLSEIGQIGVESTASNNAVLVTGVGSLWSNSSTVTIGRLGLNNSLTVVAGGRVAASGILLADANGSSGTLNIGRFGANDAAGTVVTPTIAFGAGTGAINFNQSNALTITSVISGNGGLNQLGVGTTTLSGVSTYSGATTVGGGTLALSGGGRLSALTAIDLTGSGALFDISGITASGSTNGSLAGVAGSRVNLGSKNLNVGGNNTSTTFAGVIGGAGSLTKAGTGTMALTGINAYTGGTLVNGGTLSLNATNTLADAGTVTVTGVGSLLTNSTTLFVGNASTGNQLVVTNGGFVVDFNGVIGNQSTSSNNIAAVAGPGSLWSNIHLVVGSSGSGNQLVISNGATARSTQAAVGDASTASNNVATITGSGSLWTNEDSLRVGFFGSGNQLVVSNGGMLASDGGDIGSSGISSNNAVLVTGVGSLWTNVGISGDISVGSSGSLNQLIVSNGGRVASDSGVIGNSGISSNNIATVTGAGSLWINNFGLSVGNSGSANRLVVSNGAEVLGRSGDIGSFSTASNNLVLVTGAGSLWSNSSTVTVGRQGLNNSLTLVAGGTVTASGILLADSNGASGTLNIGRFGANDAAGTVVTPTISFGRGTGALNFNQSDAVVMTSVISGNGTLNQLGTGTTTLAALNTYGGVTTVGGGILRVTNLADAGVSSAIGTNATIVLSNGGILDYAGTTNSAMNRTINLAGGNGGIGVSNSAVSLTLSGVISNTGNLIKSGLGRLVLVAANTFSGTTTVSAGVLRAANNAALGSTAAGTRVAGGAALELSGGITVGAESLDLSGTGIGGGGALRSVSGNNIYQGTITNTAAARINADAGLLTLGGAINANNQLLTLGGSGNMALSGPITNSTAGLTKDGTGTATLTGASTYTGATTVSAGVLRAANNTALGATTAATRVASGAALELTGGITVGAESLDLSGTGIGGGGALRSVSGNNIYQGTITNTAAARINADAGLLTLSGAINANNQLLTLGGSGNMALSGPITNSTAGLTKDGGGTATLTGVSTYSGVATVSAGVLRAANNAALGSTAAGTRVASGAALELAGGITVGAESLDLSGTGIGGGGALRSVSGNNIYQGTITNTAAARINADAGLLTLGGAINANNQLLTLGGSGNMALSGPITNSTAGLTKDGTGTATLTGVSTYTGATTVGGGTLALSGGGRLSALTAIDLTGSGALFDISGITASGSTNGSLAGVAGSRVNLGSKNLNVGGNNTSTTFAGVIGGAGSLNKTGTGTMALTGINAYTGGTLVNGGTLSLNATNTLADAGTVTVTGVGSLLTNSTTLFVGNASTGNRLAVTNGGRVRNRQGVIGNQAASDNNIATVTGAGSLWSNFGSLIVGDAGSGNQLVVSNLGAVNSAQNSFLGTLSGPSGVIGAASTASNNIATVTGAGSLWSNLGSLIVGYAGSGNQLVVSNGGDVVSRDDDPAFSAGAGAIGATSTASNNIATVTGAGSRWDNLGSLTVGGEGSGNQLVIGNGAEVRSSGPDFYQGALIELVRGAGRIGGASTASNNIATVSGAGSLWTNDGWLLVGISGSGNQLVVSNSGTVRSTKGTIGDDSGASNNIATVTGAGSLWSNSSSLTVGRLGLNNSLTLSAGGAVAASGIVLADSNGSSGTLNIGRLGASDAAGTIITPTIRFGAGNGTINLNQNNTLTLTSAISGNGTLNQLGAGTTTLTASNAFAGPVAVSGGTLALNSASGSALGGASSISVGNGAALSLAQSGQVNDSAAITLSGGTIRRGSGVSEAFGNLNVTSFSFLDYGTGTAGNLTFGTLQNNATPSTALLGLNNFTPGNSFSFSSTSFTEASINSYFTFGAGFQSFSLSNTGSTFTLTSVASPAIRVAGARFAAFSTTEGTPSEAQTVHVSGSELEGDLIVTASSGNEVSYDGVNFAPVVALEPLGGSVGITTIRVRLSGESTGPVDGEVTFASAGATPQTRAVSGEVVASAYETWARDYGLDPAATTGATAGARTADPDGDGFENFREFCFGGDPTAVDDPSVAIDVIGNGLLLTWIQRDNDVNYVVESMTGQNEQFTADGNVTVVNGPSLPTLSAGYSRKQATVQTIGSKFFRVQAYETEQLAP